MNIAHVNLAKGFRGGERQTLLLIEQLAKNDKIFQSAIIRKNSPLALKIKQIKTINNIKIIFASHFLAGFKKLVNINLIHVHEGRAVYFAFLQKMLYKIPYIITRRIVTKISSNKITKLAYKKADKIIVLSQAIKKSIHQQIKIDTQIIPSCFAGNITNKEPRDLPKNKFIIAQIGALEKIKGQQFSIEVAKILENSLPMAHFIFLGSGTYEKQLKNQAKGLKNVFFLGFKNNIYDYYSKIDLFIFPSIEEGLGSSIIDAFFYKVPVIASKSTGILDLVKDNQTGLLVNIGDVNSLAIKVKQLYNNPDLAKKLAENAYKQALIKYSPKTMIDSYLQIYKDLI